MPVEKCSRCGRVAKIEETSQCLRCGEMIFVKSKQARGKDRKIVSSIILAFLLLGGTAAVVTYFILQQREKAVIASEKQQFAGFDTINFKADAGSVDAAVKTLPDGFRINPPNIDTIKRNVDEFESSNQKSEKSAVTGLSSRFDRKGSQSVGYKITSSSLIDLEPLQFDYVKAPGNRLVCFILYRAKLGILETGASPLQMPLDPVTRKPLGRKLEGKKVGEREVTETARYDYENGMWTFNRAGISDLERMKQIDQIRIDAKIGAQ